MRCEVARWGTAWPLREVECLSWAVRQKERAMTIIWSSDYGFTVDALELYGDEGRGKLRKAAVRSTHPATRGWPNGVTHLERSRY